MRTENLPNPNHVRELDAGRVARQAVDQGRQAALQRNPGNSARCLRDLIRRMPHTENAEHTEKIHFQAFSEGRQVALGLLSGALCKNPTQAAGGDRSPLIALTRGSGPNHSGCGMRSDLPP